MAEDTPGTRAAIRREQEHKLRRLLETLAATNRFYQRKLGNNPTVASRLSRLTEFSRLVPFTTKAELVADQRVTPPYGTNLTYPLDRYTRAHQTSGTTGAPLRWLDTTESWSALVDVWAEVLKVAGVTAHDRVVFAFSFGPFIGFWLAFEAAGRLGALCLPTGGLSTVARLKVITDHRATVICCTPTYALRLAEVAAEERIDLARCEVRSLVVAGEPGGSIPATRSRIEQLWPGAKVFDHHGMTEVGPVTHECAAQPGVLHVVESAFLAEVVHPTTGEPVGAQERGELILTTLHRTGSPLLRYRTGDLVCPRHAPDDLSAPACACGRATLALEGGILGRVDDMLIIRGVNVFPAAIEEILRGFPEVAEYQVAVTRPEGLPEMIIRIEPSAGCIDLAATVRDVAHTLQTALSLRIPVIPVPPGRLPRFELKAKRWVQESA